MAHNVTFVEHHTFYKKNNWEPDELFVFGTVFCSCGNFVKVNPADFFTEDYEEALDDAISILKDDCDTAV